MDSYCVRCRKEVIKFAIIDDLVLCSICTMRRYDDIIRLKIIADQRESLKQQIEELNRQEKSINNIYKMKKRKR